MRLSWYNNAELRKSYFKNLCIFQLEIGFLPNKIQLFKSAITTDRHFYN